MTARFGSMREAKRARDLVVGITALSAAQAAWAASDPSLVLVTSLGLFALMGGALSGLLAAFKPSHVRFLPAFLTYLGLLSMVATTRAKSMEALPLTLVLGTALGILPFAAAYFAVRAVTLRFRRSAKDDRGDR